MENQLANDPGALTEHAGHKIFVTIDRHELPAVAITRCYTCHQDIERRRLPIRVIAFGSMCFGDLSMQFYHELMPMPMLIPPDDAPSGTHRSHELRAYIADQVATLHARAEMSTVCCSLNYRDEARMTEPAMLIEPVAIEGADPALNDSAIEEFETLWQAHYHTDEVAEALAIMPLIREIMWRYQDSYYDQGLNSDEYQAMETHSRFIKAVERLYTYLHPTDEPTPVTPPAHDPNDDRNQWWEENPPKTEAASC